MTTYIALLRGVNVGGNNRLPMADLKGLLEKLGLRDVQTYIQSGNAVLRSGRADAAELAREIGRAIGRGHGFTPSVLLLSAEEFDAALAANPFPEAEAEPKSLHLFFLDAAPERPNLKALELLKTDTERFALRGKVFYLHTPDGIGRSRLAAKDWGWGVAMTARNWRTVSTLREMARQSPG